MNSYNGKINKDLIVMIMALGDAYLEKGLYAEAAKRYRQLLEFRVANKHIYSNLSKALIGLKKFDRFALEIYQRTIQYDPNNREIYHVLADSFMSENRDDDSAIQVYQASLEHDSPSFDSLAGFLSEIYYQRNDFEKCREITAKILEGNGYQPQSLELFMLSAWKTGKFHNAINLLKKLIDTTENNMVLLKHLCRTYLEKKFDGEARNQLQHFSFIDRQLIKDFLQLQTEFDKLQDLMFYLELKCFLLDKTYWGNFYQNETDETGEMIADEAETIEFSAKLKTQTIQKSTPGHDVFSKLNTFESISGKSLIAKSSLTFEDFQKKGVALFNDSDIETGSFDLPAAAEILLAIEVINFADIHEQFGPQQVEQVQQKLLVLLADFLEKYQMGHVWCATNGLVIVTTDIIKAVSLAVDFLNKLNRYNFVNEPQEQIHLAIGIHHSRDGFESNNEQTMKDLSTGIKLATIKESDLTPDDRAVFGKAVRKTNRIFLSSKAYREVRSSNRFKLNSIGQFRLKYLKETLSLHEVSWRNPTDELKFGYIKKISRFELLAELGGKGAIKVYKAKDADLHRFIILKVIQSDVFNSLPANNPQKQEFYQYAKAIGQLNHPNIVTIYEIDEDHGLTYIAREYVEANSFTGMFRNGNGFNVDRFIKAVYQVFKGLQYSHRFGFFHLNLKPSNVLMGQNDECKIMDFLIPGQLFNDPKITEINRTCVAPEQVAGNHGDGRSDIFSMGVLMYETLTQSHPFTNRGFSSVSEAILHKTPVPPSEISGNIPRFCDALVLKCLEKRPENRFQSVEQIVNLLKKNFERALFSNFNVQIAKSRESYE